MALIPKKLPELEEFYAWHLSISNKIVPLLLEARDIAREKVANNNLKDWRSNEWLKEKDPDLFEEFQVVGAATRILNTKITDPNDMDIVMNYYVETHNKGKIVPQMIQSIFAHYLFAYMKSKKDGKPITLGQAFKIEKTKGKPPRNNKLTPEVNGITREIIENELELSKAIEAYQMTQMDINLDIETSTETLRTMFHEQKVDALFVHVLMSNIASVGISNKARKLIGRYWTAEEDPIKIGIREES